MLQDLLRGNGSAEGNIDITRIAHGIPESAPLPDTLPPHDDDTTEGAAAPSETHVEEDDMPEGVPVEGDMVFLASEMPDDLMFPSMVPDPLPTPDLSLPDDPGQSIATPVPEYAGMPDFCEPEGLPAVALDALPPIVCEVAMHDDDDEDEDFDVFA